MTIVKIQIFNPFLHPADGAGTELISFREVPVYEPCGGKFMEVLMP
jgi:hypothetical protein